MTVADLSNERRKRLEGESVDVEVVKTLESTPASGCIRASRDDATEEVVFFLRGGCELQFGEARLTVGPGQGVIVPADFQKNDGQIALRFDDGECIRVSVREREQQSAAR